MTIASNEKLFFFFGSLRTGYWNQRILSDSAKRLGLARTLLPFALYISEGGTVPTTIPNLGTTPLIGEVFALNEQDSRSVFRLETGYESGTFQVRLENGDVVEAIIFHHTSPAACYYMSGKPVLIPSGDYTQAIAPNGARMAPPVIMEGSPALIDNAASA